MFDLRRTNPIIPGYTGFIPKTFGEGGIEGRPKPRSEVPGYGGYIPAVKPESIFGKTYGQATWISSAGDYEAGSEISHRNRYTSLLQESYVNQSTITPRKVADVVGIPATKVVYTKDGAVKVPLEVWNRTGGFGNPPPPVKKEQTVTDSTRQFFGVDEAKEIHSLGKPLPGYTGFIKRVAADNIFGTTYGDGMKKGHASYAAISEDKTNNLSTQSRRVPPIRF
jgi:hypothetical protein